MSNKIKWFECVDYNTNEVVGYLPGYDYYEVFKEFSKKYNNITYILREVFVETCNYCFKEFLMDSNHLYTQVYCKECWEAGRRINK